MSMPSSSEEVATIAREDTILGWFRELVAEKWTHKRRSPGRPRIMEVIADLAKIRGLEPGQIRRDGERLLGLVAEGAQRPREEWPTDDRRSRPLDARQEALVDLLSAALRLIAEQHQLSPMAIASRKELEKLVPEGIEGRVPYKGTMLTILHQLMGGVRSSMGYTGCASIEEMRSKPEFIRVTNAGMRESHVHDVSITKEAPNYRID